MAQVADFTVNRTTKSKLHFIQNKVEFSLTPNETTSEAIKEADKN